MRAREVEQLIDRAPHPLAAGEHTAERLSVLGRFAAAALAQQHDVGGGHDRAERVAEVVRQRARELVLADRFLELLHRGNSE